MQTCLIFWSGIASLPWTISTKHTWGSLAPEKQTTHSPQPYSPHLFRQGELPGPQLLLQVLLKQKTYAEARAAWKKVEVERKERSGSEPDAGPWMLRMEIPCRSCTDKAQGEEVCKRISAFTTEHTADGIWTKLLSHGQDACCFKCRHKMGWKPADEVIPCDGCGKILPRKNF